VSVDAEGCRFKTSSQAHLPIQPCIKGAPVVHCPRIKRPGHKVDLSPPSKAEVKNDWSYAPTPSVFAFVADMETASPFTCTRDLYGLGSYDRAS
jgi:hypothetical protein